MPGTPCLEVVHLVLGGGQTRRMYPKATTTICGQDWVAASAKEVLRPFIICPEAVLMGWGIQSHLRCGRLQGNQQAGWLSGWRWVLHRNVAALSHMYALASEKGESCSECAAFKNTNWSAGTISAEDSLSISVRMTKPLTLWPLPLPLLGIYPADVVAQMPNDFHARLITGVRESKIGNNQTPPLGNGYITGILCSFKQEWEQF